MWAEGSCVHLVPFCTASFFSWRSYNITPALRSDAAASRSCVCVCVRHAFPRGPALPRVPASCPRWGQFCRRLPGLPSVAGTIPHPPAFPVPPPASTGGLPTPRPLPCTLSAFGAARTRVRIRSTPTVGKGKGKEKNQQKTKPTDSAERGGGGEERERERE